MNCSPTSPRGLVRTMPAFAFLLCSVLLSCRKDHFDPQSLPPKTTPPVAATPPVKKPVNPPPPVNVPATGFQDHFKVVSSTDIGLVGDGRTDNGGRLNQYISQHRSVHINLQKGNYLLDALNISTDSITLDGQGSGILCNSQTGSGNLIEVHSKAVRLQNLVLDGSSNNSLKTGIEIGGTDNVVVDGLTINNFPLYGVDIAYSNNVTVSNTKVDHAFEGLQFWGGDSKDHAGTPLNNLSFIGNTVSNITGGGIWGSMGNHIVMAGNTVSNCGDVGLDLEGCINSVVRNNTVSNCTNACVSLFFGCNTVTVAANRLSATNSQNGVRFFTSKWMHSNIEVDSNQIQADNSMAFLIEEKTASNVRFKGNQVSGNFAWGLRSISNDGIQIQANNFSLTNASYGVSNEGGAQWTIELNVLKNTNTQGAGQASTGLNITVDPGQTVFGNTVASNTITGFSTPVLNSGP